MFKLRWQGNTRRDGTCLPCRRSCQFCPLPRLHFTSLALSNYCVPSLHLAISRSSSPPPHTSRKLKLFERTKFRDSGFFSFATNNDHSLLVATFSFGFRHHLCHTHNTGYSHQDSYRAFFLARNPIYDILNTF